MFMYYNNVPEEEAEKFFNILLKVNNDLEHYKNENEDLFKRIGIPSNSYHLEDSCPYEIKQLKNKLNKLKNLHNLNSLDYKERSIRILE